MKTVPANGSAAIHAGSFFVKDVPVWNIDLPVMHPLIQEPSLNNIEPRSISE
jgi:hypothetical protein